MFFVQALLLDLRIVLEKLGLFGGVIVVIVEKKFKLSESYGSWFEKKSFRIRQSIIDNLSLGNWEC